MTLAELLALLPDNTSGEISPADLRVVVASLFTASTDSNNPGPWTALAASATFRSLPAPGPVVAPITVQYSKPLLLVLSGYIDSAVNNNEVSLALDLSGATTAAAGSKPHQVMRVGAKTNASSTVSLTYLEQFAVGTTTAEIKYKADLAGATVSDLAISLVVLS